MSVLLWRHLAVRIHLFPWNQFFLSFFPKPKKYLSYVWWTPEYRWLFISVTVLFLVVSDSLQLHELYGPWGSQSRTRPSNSHFLSVGITTDSCWSPSKPWSILIEGSELNSLLVRPLTVCPWANSLPSLCFHFFICKKGCWTKWLLRSLPPLTLYRREHYSRAESKFVY